MFKESTKMKSEILIFLKKVSRKKEKENTTKPPKTYQISPRDKNKFEKE